MSHILLIVGAHNGAKQAGLIQKCAANGKVILMEPVPYLFEALSARYANQENITCLNKAIDFNTGHKSFFMVTSDGNKIAPWGDQLGSFNPQHALLHDQKFQSELREINVPTISFEDLIAEYQITNLRLLLTDTEGFDAQLLQSFPFEKLMPDEILFEYKHSDGVFRIGKNFANLLAKLDQFDYHMKIIDMENCHAKRIKQ